MKRSFILLLLLCLFNDILKAQVFTPNGVQVPPAALKVYDNVSPNTNGELQVLQNSIANGAYGPSCEVLANYTRQYNCHGYAWHTSTGGSQVVILAASGGVTPYVAGGNPSYVQGNYSGSQGKMRVSYTGDHSAVTTYLAGKFISKWGAGPLVRHNSADVPPGYGLPSTYWTCNYAPPLTSVYLDGKLISGSFQNTTWGAHNMQIFWGLDPDTGPVFSPTAASTIINNQSSGVVNFNFSGPSNNGGLSISFCGTPRYSYTFFKPSGYKMQVYPNPVEEEGVISIKTDSQGQIEAVNLDSEINKMVKLSLLDEKQRVIQHYLPDLEGSQTTVKLKAGLKGLYFLKATFEDGTEQIRRVVVE